MQPQIYPCIWYNNNAQEMAALYCATFANSSITSSNNIVVKMLLHGNTFMLLNGGDKHLPTEAVSFVVECDTQEEIDNIWESLTINGGQVNQCGWCKDKYGVSWQIIPTILPQLMSNHATAKKVMEAFMLMKKMNIATFQKAAKMQRLFSTIFAKG